MRLNLGTIFFLVLLALSCISAPAAQYSLSKFLSNDDLLRKIIFTGSTAPVMHY